MIIINKIKNMLLNLNNKKNTRIHKSFGKLSVILIVMFIASFINIPFVKKNDFEAQAQTIVDNKIDYSDEVDVIKIIEVGPGNVSQLTGKKYSDDEMPAEKAYTVNGKKVSITYVSMPLFISMVDDISAKYDIVTISNNTTGLDSSYDKTKKFRQYTNPQGQVRKGKVWASDIFPDGMSKEFTEYYSENDITKKRANKIIEMINKGQLVYMDRSILSNSLSKTNLYNIFNSIDRSNFIKTSSSNLIVSDLIDKYSEIGKERPKIQYVYTPKNEVISDGQVTNERNMQFKINVKSNNNQKIRIKLYLDVNSDGLYAEDELEKSMDFVGNSEGEEYAINYKVVKTYVGLLPWKLETVYLNDDGSEGTKSFSQYNVKLKSQYGKKLIRVLQIYPNIIKDKDGDDTILSNNDKFNGLLNSLEDYKVTFNNMSVDEFCSSSRYSSGNGYENLEEDYEMIIIGFCDNYNNEDFDRYEFHNALENIKQFVAHGNSMMLTHDTVTLYSGKTEKFTKKFRDYVGQSRYIDPFRNGDESNLYKQYDANEGKYVIKPINHDEIIGDAKYTYYTYGETLLSKDGDINTWNGGGYLYKSTTSFKVKNINNGPITQYPYDLGSSTNVQNVGYINVSQTHRQFFQLNLEDEDLVPWYDITPDNGYILNVGGGKGGDFSSNDARNFYYTYSKGNITYSGTGHSGVSNKLEELKLFVNTIVKAYRGANHKPDIENTIKTTDEGGNVEENKIEDGDTSPINAKRSEDYVFYTTASDEDLDKVQVSITADDNNITDIKIADTDENYDGSLISSDTKLKVTISKDIYKDKVVGKQIEINVKAKDDMDVENNKGFNVNIGNTPPEVKSYDNSAFLNDTIDEDKSMVNLCEEGKILLDGTSNLSFTSIPSDLDGDKMNIYVETIGLKDALNGINEYKNKISNKNTNDKVNITIPKEYFKDKSKGQSFKVNVTVKDVVSGIEQDSYTESFTVKIGNHTPSLVNNELNAAFDYNEISTDTDGDGYKNAKIEVNSADSRYLFMTKINDIDTSDKLKLTVYCEDSTGEGFNEVASYINRTPDSNIVTAIPNKYYEKSVAGDILDENYSKYADKKRGESFKVKTVVEDNNDPSASYEEIFTVKIADNNIPQIVPYEINGTTEISQGGTSVNTMAFAKTYDFYAKVSDLDVTDDLKVEAFVNDIPATFTTDGTSLEEIVFKDGDKFRLKIPANRSFSKNGKIKVTLKVTDSYGATSSRSFNVNIGANNAPIVTNYEVGTDSEILNDATSTNIITIGNPFEFDVIPFDEDDDLLNVKVSIEDGDIIHEIPYKDCVSGEKISNIYIPRSYYSSKFKGDIFKVNVKAEDGDGGVGEKSFKVKIKDDDSTELTNYESNGEDVILDKGTSINNPNVNSIFTKDELGQYVLGNSLSGDDFNFVTLPKDSDDEFVKIYIKVQVNGEMKLVKAYDNVKSNEKLSINIPRSYFKDLRRGDSFKVYVDVSDNKGDSSIFNENPCDSKSFTVKIKDNELPQITNYNGDSTEISDKASFEAIKEENYKFKSNIRDNDDKVVKLNVKVEGVSVVDKYVDEGIGNEIEIPTSYYAYLGRGNEFSVVVTATDEFGGTSTKEFKVKIKDNELPELDNYTANEDLTKNTLIDNNGDGGVAKTFKDYIFIIVPKDSDDPYVDVVVKADGTDILSKENVQQGQDLPVTIPKSIYENKNTGDKFDVVVTVKDKNGGTTEKSFTVTVKANNPPVINNYFKKNNIYVGNDTPSQEAAIGKDEIKNNDIIHEKNEETEAGYEFITIPKDEDENDKNNLKVSVRAETKEGTYDLLQKTNAISEDEITVLIPKDIYKNLGKDDAINITTTVTDLSGESDKKEFDLIINHGPAVINKDANKSVIEENSSVDVTRYHDFNFYSVCNDIDEEDHLNLKVYLEDELINDVNLLKDQLGYDVLLDIGNEKFNHLNENEKMKVTTVVTDSKGKSSKKSFYINMTDDAPTMINYNVDKFEDIESQITNERIIPSCDVEAVGKENAIKQNKYLDFIFVSVVNDSNKLEDLNVKITAKLISENVDCEETVLNAKANGVTISSNDSIKSDTRVSATIPQSIYKNSVPGDYVKIVTTVTDEFNKSSSNVFYLQIDDIIPTLNHGVIASENINGSITVNTSEISPRVRTYDTVKFGGIATDVYCTNGQDAKLKLSVSNDIDVLGDVVVYRILNKNGNIVKSNEWKMTYNSSDKCYYLNVSYDKATAIGKIEPEGMTIIVKYNGYMKTKSTTIRRDFINHLYVNSAESDANVYTQDFTVDTVPLF